MIRHQRSLWWPHRIRLAGAVLLALAMLLPFSSPPAHADEGWAITRFDIQIAIQPDGSLNVIEVVDVDFSTPRHGIFRDIPYMLEYDRDHLRRYDIGLTGVMNPDGRAIPTRTSHPGRLVRFTIGDPDRTVSGVQSYHIRYRVRDALNAFPDHDELYWNVTGVWPVPVSTTTVTVTAPGGGVGQAACYQGAAGSTERCSVGAGAGAARFAATRLLQAGEQLTVVVALPKGVVPEPAPALTAKPRRPADYFERTSPILAAAALMTATAFGGLGLLWWRVGRDRRYTTLNYLTDDPHEESRLPFSHEPVVVEFEPPDDLRPAQLGLLIDERADTLDLTATIVDLAVRGYVRITEIPKTGLFGKKDWRLERLKDADDALLEYEQVILTGLFHKGSPVEMSDLKTQVRTYLTKAQGALYRDATRRGWFVRNPASVRSWYMVAGFGVAAAGGGLMYLFGRQWGAALAAAPLILAGLALAALANAMPRRAAAGRELFRRGLGFRRYIDTAEKSRHEFNERSMIFARYLPYAIVYGLVDRWARAFRDIDAQAATVGWYAGSSAFSASSFSRDLQDFSGAVSTTISSTPGGSGGSGFSGGSAGGGGGGGGGGSW